MESKYASTSRFGAFSIQAGLPFAPKVSEPLEFEAQALM
jgi:hypothetical protein